MKYTSSKGLRIAFALTSTLFLVLALVISISGNRAVAIALLTGAGLLELIFFVVKRTLEANRLSGSYTMMPFMFIPVYRTLYTPIRLQPHETPQNEGEEEFVPFRFKDTES